jgi:PilZ domain
MEQRKAQRFDLRLPVELVRGGTRSLAETGETRNLSSVGVLFRSEARLRVGEPLEYLITLPTAAAESDQVRIHCLGKVVRLPRKTEVAATLERYEFVR